MTGEVGRLDPSPQMHLRVEVRPLRSGEGGAGRVFWLTDVPVNR